MGSQEIQGKEKAAKQILCVTSAADMGILLVAGGVELDGFKMNNRSRLLRPAPTSTVAG